MVAGGQHGHADGGFGRIGKASDVRPFLAGLPGLPHIPHGHIRVAPPLGCTVQGGKERIEAQAKIGLDVILSPASDSSKKAATWPVWEFSPAVSPA